ncbi:MAG: hypothetical protein O2871_01450 [bacterium]|nr:hypothetical protein [bacterium]
MKKLVKLILQNSIDVNPLTPFLFDPTFHKPDHFTTGDNYWEKGIKWQSWNWQNTPVGIKFIDSGTVKNPVVKIEIYAKNKLSDEFVESLIAEIKYLYNFELDLTDFYNTFKNDDFLKQIIQKWKGMRPGHPSCLYEYLIVGMVLQNASVRRSVQMFKVLLENYGTNVEFDGKNLWSFWTVGDLSNVSEQDLRDLKVGYRAKSIKKLDEYFSKGLINETELRKKDRETQQQELLKIYGVGPATVWYLLFDVFHHWDFFNHISPWEQKIYSKLFFDTDTTAPVSVEKLFKYIERFRKYKHLAIHYIWEDLWWKRVNKNIEWLEKEIRL